MDIRVDATPDEIIIAPSGSINTATAPEFEQVVASTLADAAALNRLTFDFSDLDYISSAGLRVLMIAYKGVMAEGGTIGIAHTSAEVQEILDITGLADLFES